MLANCPLAEAVRLTLRLGEIGPHTTVALEDGLKEAEAYCTGTVPTTTPMQAALAIPEIKELTFKLLVIDKARRRLSPLYDLMELCILAKDIVAKANTEKETPHV